MKPPSSRFPKAVLAERLSTVSYRAYGDVVDAASGIAPRPANMGTARRYDFLGELKNLRPKTAKPNLCVFRCAPQVRAPRADFAIRLLERHPFSTQAFVPMGGPARYLVVVCLGGGSPDLSTLRAFLATGAQGVTYRPGVWHHPLIALDRRTDFACLVWEDGTSGDCEVRRLGGAIRIDFPP